MKCGRVLRPWVGVAGRACVSTLPVLYGRAPGATSRWAERQEREGPRERSVVYSGSAAGTPPSVRKKAAGMWNETFRTPLPPNAWSWPAPGSHCGTIRPKVVFVNAYETVSYAPAATSYCHWEVEPVERRAVDRGQGLRRSLGEMAL